MSPLVVIIFVAVLLVLFQLSIGARGSRETRRIYSYLLQDAKRRAQRTFTVTVVLDRRAESIFQLLDRLYEQGYDKLQILVIVKQTAGSKAITVLEGYKRQNRRKGLKMVRHQKRMTTETAASTYGTGEYTISLDAKSELSPRFFEVSSQILSATRPSALVVRSLTRPSRTFKQAVWSLTSLIRTTLSLSTPRLLPTNLLIQKRKLTKKQEGTPPLVYASSQFYSLEPVENTKPLSWRILITAITSGLLVIGVYVAVATLLDVPSANLYGAVLIGTIEVAALMCMLQVQGYRFVDYVNTLLFIPIAPLYAGAYSIARLVRTGATALRRPRLSAQR